LLAVAVAARPSLALRVAVELVVVPLVALKGKPAPTQQQTPAVAVVAAACLQRAIRPEAAMAVLVWLSFAMPRQQC
jgi:hypothetical protein